MRSITICLVVLGVLTLSGVECALQFELTIDRPRCFVEELFKGSVMVVNHRVEGINDNDEHKITQFLSWIQLSIISESTGQILKRDVLKAAKGKTSFHATEEGFYKICVTYHGGWTFPYQTLLSLKIHSDNMDEPDISKAIKFKDLDPVHKKASEIVHTGSGILERQKNETAMEDSMAGEQIHSSKYYYNMAVLQVLVVLVLGVYQVFSFRKFLVNNNVI